MFIYLVERTDNWDFDEYDSIVVSAVDEQSAIEIAKDYLPDNINITLIGRTIGDVRGLILSSFNAGSIPAGTAKFHSRFIESRFGLFGSYAQYRKVLPLSLSSRQPP